jgi:hypothetical protein
VGIAVFVGTGFPSEMGAWSFAQKTCDVTELSRSSCFGFTASVVFPETVASTAAASILLSPLGQALFHFIGFQKKLVTLLRKPNTPPADSRKVAGRGSI